MRNRCSTILVYAVLVASSSPASSEIILASEATTPGKPVAGIRVSSAPRSSSGRGTESLVFYGVTRGAVHGLLVSDALSERGRASNSTRTAGALIGALGEATAGWMIARRVPITAGQAHALANHADYGLLVGTTVSWLADFGDRKQAAIRLGSTALGLAGGALLLPRHRDLSWGDVEVARAAGITGGIAGLCIAVSLDPNSDDSDQDGMNAGTLIGATLGLLAGDRLVRDTEFSWRAATSVDLAVVGSALCPLVILGALDRDDDNRYAFVVSAGAIAGWVTSYVTSRDENRPAGHSSIHIEANPLAFAALVNRRTESRTRSGAIGNAEPATLMGFRLRY